LIADEEAEDVTAEDLPQSALPPLTEIDLDDI
jgi:hypothetical protein